MEKTNLDIIDWLLSERKSVPGKTSQEFDAFRQVFYQNTESWDAPVDRAVVGGFFANCVAFAFAAGYCSSLQCLVPSLPEKVIACFCISEEGGGHPRAIKSQLVALEDNTDQGKTYKLNGKKKYVTCAKEADVFLVAASLGISDDGKNKIQMIKINSKTPGITIVPMTNINLVPEISHCELTFTDVKIFESDILPGDGYTEYIKPFRTVEDLHISAGILGYLFQNACKYDWSTYIKEIILGCIVSARTLALSNPTAPAVHIVTGDVLKQIKELFKQIEPEWGKIGGKAQKAWDRDKILMSIADKVRTRRLETAWQFYEEKELSADSLLQV